MRSGHRPSCSCVTLKSCSRANENIANSVETDGAKTGTAALYCSRHLCSEKAGRHGFHFAAQVVMHRFYRQGWRPVETMQTKEHKRVWRVSAPLGVSDWQAKKQRAFQGKHIACKVRMKSLPCGCSAGRPFFNGLGKGAAAIGGTEAFCRLPFWKTVFQTGLLRPLASPLLFL